MKERDYQQSCEKAKLLGYEAISDPMAYRGVSFQKDGQKYILSKSHLKAKLGVTKDEQLEFLSYNVDEYNEFKDVPNAEIPRILTRKELLAIFEDCNVNEMGLRYLSDSIYLTEEGDLIDTKG